jgi:thioredoxin reductase
VRDRPQVVIVGAGPYGLSIAAHLKASGARFRIFGSPMGTWREQMPRGMYLKSDGFASSLSDPQSSFTLKKYCEQEGIGYDDTRVPVSLETFTAYGLEFQRRFVPELEEKQVREIARDLQGFLIRLEDGETLRSQLVILAVGVTHFPNTPPELCHLPPRLLSHSSAHHDLAGFSGHKVTVLGAGASALDLGALLHEVGAEVTLIARRHQLRFHDAPGDKPRPLWHRLRHPQTGIGPGLRSHFYTNAPLLFRRLPGNLRLKIVRTHLGPSAGWPMKERFQGKVRLLLGCSIESAEAQGNCVHITLRTADGTTKQHTTEHIVAATGYKADLNKLKFLSQEIRSQVRTLDNSPVLSSRFESSVPGLYFVGLAAANMFGPMLRFAYGSDFTARHLSKHIAARVR